MALGSLASLDSPSVPEWVNISHGRVGQDDGRKRDSPSLTATVRLKRSLGLILQGLASRAPELVDGIYEISSALPPSLRPGEDDSIESTWASEALLCADDSDGEMSEGGGGSIEVLSGFLKGLVILLSGSCPLGNEKGVGQPRLLALLHRALLAAATTSYRCLMCTLDPLSASGGSSAALAEVPNQIRDAARRAAAFVEHLPLTAIKIQVGSVFVTVSQ